MYETHFYPHVDDLKRRKDRTPAHMYPSDLPYAVAFEGYLDDEQCDAIIVSMLEEESYKTPGCGAALTREMSPPIKQPLQPIRDLVQLANGSIWDFDIDLSTATAWLQTYGVGNDYQAHVDTAFGQTRKMTAVALLTEANDYTGGDLVICTPGVFYKMPHSRGTIVLFPSYHTHEVTPVTRGVRQTINMGFWGPAWR